MLRNNHLRQHREVLREESSKKPQKGTAPPADVRLLALYWDASSQPPSAIFNICAERVRARGANHQTLRADPTAPPAGTRPSAASIVHQDVIWKFIRESEELLPSEVDGVIDMPLGEPLEDSVRRAVAGVVRELGLPTPSEDKIKEGVEKAATHRVAEKNKKPDAVVEKKKNVRYFGFVPEIDVEGELDRVFALKEGVEGCVCFWNVLKEGGRVVVKPHVTIVHRKELPKSETLWERCRRLVDEEPRAEFWLRLSHVLWDGRVMAMVVQSVTPAGVGAAREGEGPFKVAKEFVLGLPERECGRFHVTVGTRDANIEPVEAKALVEGWRRGEENTELRTVTLGPDGLTVKAKMSGLWS